MGNWAKIIISDSRRMPEVEDESIGLVVTSPPYWHIKDYGVAGQIGYGQTLHEYLKDLYRVWKECYRVLITWCHCSASPASGRGFLLTSRRS
ncbi:MAG: DNA modification methylase [Candidatus Alkanophagales archaeon MCA70_species_2]|nr:DNA modification methylase [Candidatus Alkanophaga liquidiphilum]